MGLIDKIGLFGGDPEGEDPEKGTEDRHPLCL